MFARAVVLLALWALMVAAPLTLRETRHERACERNAHVHADPRAGRLGDGRSFARRRQRARRSRQARAAAGAVAARVGRGGGIRHSRLARAARPGEGHRAAGQAEAQGPARPGDRVRRGGVSTCATRHRGEAADSAQAFLRRPCPRVAIGQHARSSAKGQPQGVGPLPAGGRPRRAAGGRLHLLPRAGRRRSGVHHQQVHARRLAEADPAEPRRAARRNRASRKGPERLTSIRTCTAPRPSACARSSARAPSSTTARSIATTSPASARATAT